MKTLFFILFVMVNALNFAQTKFYGLVKDAESNKELPYAKVKWIINADTLTFLTDEFGRFDMKLKSDEIVICQILYTGYEIILDTIYFNQSTIEKEFKLNKLNVMHEIIIEHKNENETSRMSVIDGATLTHSKKTQVLNIEKIPANTASNNSRELFATVPGLNIWESDAGGLQLGIGARGLSPNRTEHFNTRQNGYDISADALGYPESYYTPPADAIESIQIIRGASSLQFGPQFGGMVNFKLITPSTKKIAYTGSQSYGTYNLINTFNAVSGTFKKRFSYLAYYNFKSSDGWRDNSSFSQHNAFAQIKYYFTENMFISAEYTYMHYLAQQAGGLTDALFNQSPTQSIRNRNWFEVDWKILAINYQWKISRKSMLDFKFFNVDANRNALGNLDKISRIDDLQERDLIVGNFLNYGAELRLLQHYPVGKKMKGALVYGLRYYQGETENIQGTADSTDKPNFNFLNPDELTGSAYYFPSKNFAAFLENMIQVNDKIWISAGFRYEYIQTQASGSYRELVYHPITEELIFDSTYFEEKNTARSVYLAGLGITYKIKNEFEIYSNIAQNYRGINFSDIRITNPNIKIDPNMRDEKGFNADLGIRKYTPKLTFDANVFFLYYADKIGLTDLKLSEFETVRYRTNLGLAYSTGIEFFTERKFIVKNTEENYFSAFINASLVYAKYGKNNDAAYAENWVELVPPISVKTGIRYHYKNWRFAYLFSYVQKHYTDATNATFDPDAIAGLIPSYFVMDLNVNFKINEYFTLKSGVNNFTNQKYFTRRATGYPGPGIIPSDGISAYLTLSIKI